MTFLFIATIGPVQPFIASARRTRDLYVGSTLLSELSKAGAYTIAEREGDEHLIFPAPPDKSKLQPDSDLNVANKLVAIVAHSPEGLGEAVHAAILQRLCQVKQEAFGTLELANNDHKAANAQLANLIEYSWVAVDLLDDLSNYRTVRERAEAILGARKNTHFFAAVTWGNHMDKSSIDGQRESVIPPWYFVPRQGKERDANARKLYDRYKAKLHERLSAVDLLKRLAWSGKEQNAQPNPLPLMLSTSHIAATPFLEPLKDAFEKMSENDKREIHRLWDTYLQRVEALGPSSIIEHIRDKRMQLNPVTGDVDGALLFKERLLDDIVDGTQLPSVNAALEAFFSFTDKHLNGLRPSPYYAILLADGDGMGKAIDKQAKVTGHQEISQVLADFASQVRDIVNITHHGSLVYAGGDDVLALLPLHTALKCAEELHALFQTKLSKFEDKEGHSPTLSVGIAVVHHISLLQDALEVARDAERKAKDYRGVAGQPDKNALAIIVKKRGGEQNETVVSWDNQEAQLHLLATLYNADIIPKGMAYELRTMMERLQPSRRDQKNLDLQKIVQIEAARILRRKLYFSQNRVARQEHSTLEQELSTHLNSYDIAEKVRKKLEKPHDKARYILLQQINVQESFREGQESTSGGFKVLGTKNIAPFVNSLIVAQAFTEALKPTPAKGVAE